jgi:hypothetical protein
MNFSDIKKTKKYAFKKYKDIEDILDKLYISEANYSIANKEREDIFICFIYYYKKSDENANIINYPNYGFDFVIDKKALLKLKREEIDNIINKLINKYKKRCDDNIKEGIIRQSCFLIDERMKKYYNTIKFKDDEELIIYYLKVKAGKEFLILLNNSIKSNFKYDEEFKKIIFPYYEKLYLQNDINNKIYILNQILRIYEKRIDNSNEKWIKSIGEFYALISIILLYPQNIIINSQELINIKTNRKLEFDFYLSDINNNINIVIEIDGIQHKEEQKNNNEDEIKQKNNKEKKQKQHENDIIKDILCDTGNIIIERFDWNNNIDKFVEIIYDNLTTKILLNHTIYNKKNFLDTINIIKNNIYFNYFNFDFKDEIMNNVTYISDDILNDNILKIKKRDNLILYTKNIIDNIKFTSILNNNKINDENNFNNNIISKKIIKNESKSKSNKSKSNKSDHNSNDIFLDMNKNLGIFKENNTEYNDELNLPSIDNDDKDYEEINGKIYKIAKPVKKNK